jgi:hypothetical protein
LAKSAAKAMIEKLADIALSQVGVKEIGGNNRGAKIREYQSATNLPPAAWPWCAAYVDWCVSQWLTDKRNVKWLSLKVSSPSTWRPKTASAFGLLEWARKHPNTTTILPETATVQRGDIVVFDFSHTGIVIGGGKLFIQCVEGNTNGRGERDSESGDGVWLKRRNISLVRNYIRIHPSKVQ